MADFKGFKVDGKEYPWGDYVTVGRLEGSDIGDYSTAEGVDTTASGDDSHAEGYKTIASGDFSHSEGYATTASGGNSHAEGNGTLASTFQAHAEGYCTIAGNISSHAEGAYTVALGNGSHAEGIGEVSALITCKLTSISGYSNRYTVSGLTESERSWIIPGLVAVYRTSKNNVYTVRMDVVDHLDGTTLYTTNSPGYALGYLNNANVNFYAGAVGSYSHSEGYAAHASGEYSHAEGFSTIANHRVQHVFGEYNIADDSSANVGQRGNYVEIVGNGTYNSRSNARTLDWDGNEALAGSLTLGKGTADEVTITAVQLKALLNLIAN